MRKITLLFSILTLFVFTDSRFLAQPGSNSCPALVEAALVAAGDACGGLGRNQICYGNTLIEAEGWQAVELVFEVPGDTVNVMDVASLTTAPLDVEENVWGVVIMALQVNLPDTLPGQNVTFVLFGDSRMTSEVPPQTSETPPTLTGQAAASANLRAGPNTGSGVMGGLESGDPVTIVGRSAAGDWLQLLFQDELVWVFAELIVVDGDTAVLPVRTPGGPASDAAQSFAPMQAFRLSTGTGEPACTEAPRDGLLVQTPSGTTVSFRINGIDVVVGSTAYFTAPQPQSLTVSTLEGSVQVAAEGETQVVEPGQMLTASAGTPPEEADYYPYEDVAAAPVDLLPDPVSIPVAVPGSAFWFDSGIAVAAGQTFTLSASGAVNPCVGVSHPACTFHGPEGWVGLGTPRELGFGDAAVMPDDPGAGLVGRIGADGPPFFVGAGGTFTADRSGTLQFVANDLPVENNAGAFIVIVDIEE